MDCEIVLLVENIDVCRYFYRESLGLGEPILDGTFQVVFALDEKCRLVLEKCAMPYLEHSSSACRFTLCPDDPESMLKSLRESGITPSDGFDRSGRKIYCASDPEGNVFQILIPGE